jgi:hypothetical protein
MTPRKTTTDRLFLTRSLTPAFVGSTQEDLGASASQPRDWSLVLSRYELVAKAKREGLPCRLLPCSGRADPKNGLPLIRKPFTRKDLAHTIARETGLR